MTSSFSWLDYSESERRKVLDVVQMFGDRETRDELGIGTVRDAFADLLFPGTSTIQTRARYFLFIPWIFSSIERRLNKTKKYDKQQIAQMARAEEVKLIDALATSDDNDGTIGIDARATLKRLPSNIYWQGLWVWGIRLFPSSQDQYYLSLAFHGAPRQPKKVSSDFEGDSGHQKLNWHPGIPPCPDNFPDKASFKLDEQEAEYLRERILHLIPKTLLAFLVDVGQPTEFVPFPWEHPQAGEFPSAIAELVGNARNFSESIHGAALIYNLMLARLSKNDKLIEEYDDKITEWSERIEERKGEFSSWSQKRQRFWEIVLSQNARIPHSTQRFINEWLDIALSKDSPGSVINNNHVLNLIRNRERTLKKNLARLSNRRALELWRGAAGTGQLDYRWKVTQTILADMHSAIFKVAKVA